MTPTRGRVGAVVAIKSLDRAKSRIAATTQLRRELALAMLSDTTAALAMVLDKVVVVGTDFSPAVTDQLTQHPVVDLYPDPGQDVNGAFIAGARHVLDLGYRDVLACVADLPALQASSVAEFVAARPVQSRLFLADALGTGTTMLLGRSLSCAAALNPRFEGGSAQRHRSSGAIDPGPLRWPDARHDVDTLADLASADDLGLGPATRRLQQVHRTS